MAMALGNDAGCNTQNQTKPSGKRAEAAFCVY